MWNYVQNKCKIHEPPTIHPSTSIHQRHVLPIVQGPKYSPGPFQCLVYTLQRYAGPSEKAKSAHTLFNDELFPRGQRRREGLTSSKFWGVWNVYQKSREVKNVRFWFALYDSTLWWIGPRIMNLEVIGFSFMKTRRKIPWFFHNFPIKELQSCANQLLPFPRVGLLSGVRTQEALVSKEPLPT